MVSPYWPGANDPGPEGLPRPVGAGPGPGAPDPPGGRAEPTAGRLRWRAVDHAALGVAGAGRPWPAGEVLLAAVEGPDPSVHLLAIPGAALSGAALTGFLAGVAPFGSPPPPSLIRAYVLPDTPFPSILLREHAEGTEGIGEAYARFLLRRRQWLAALDGTGPGLCPALAWTSEPQRRFVPLSACVDALRDADAAIPGVPDDYLGRGLLLLAHPEIAGVWPSMMSLGGVTKARKITGREFPLWVDLAAHQPALLASPLLERAESLLAETHPA